MLEAILTLLIGFALGYGVRDLISRRRRAAQRVRYFQTHGYYPEDRPSN